MSDLERFHQAVPEGVIIQSDHNPVGLVVDIDHFAVHDGPGIRTAVYLKGCPFRCIWCHSPETQSFSPELLYLPQKCTACGLCLDACTAGALSPIDDQLEGAASAPGAAATPHCRVAVDWKSCTHCGACAAVCYPGALKMSGAWMSVDVLISQVQKDLPFFAASGGGVTLTGGEATAQPDFSRKFLSACHAMGIHTALETNGCAPWPVYQGLLPVVDLFLYDLKQVDEADHRRLTGASNHQVLDNLRQLAGAGAAVVVRVPCIPGLNDDPAAIAATAAFMREIGLETIHLLPYNTSAGAKYDWLGREYALHNQPSQSTEKMEELAAICRSYGLTAIVEE